MTVTERYRLIIEYFTNFHDEPKTELSYTSAYELLVAVMLSAQCTDKRVNVITPAFFSRFPTIESLATATVEEVFPYIRTCSYPNSKAKYLVNVAKDLILKHSSKIPDSLEELLKLPGVGRKTANVLLSILYKKPAMAVDTHVFRVSQRIGLVINAKTPYEAEKQLVENFPPALIPKAHHWLILHGRYTCLARQPKCHICTFTDFCIYFENN